MKLKTVNRIIAIVILLANVYCVPVSFLIIKDTGGAMGFGYIILPFLLFLNILIVPAILTFINRFKENQFILCVNSLGILLILFFIWLNLK